MDIEPPTTKWDNMCSGHQRPFLSACQDKPHLQERPLIGSPPPRGQAPGYWEGPEQYLNFRLEIPNLNLDQNAKCSASNHNSRSKEKCAEAKDLASNVEGLHLQPIIVCDYADDSQDPNNATRLEAQGAEEALNLSVPTVDVQNEKKRPPISDA